ncbi:MAG: hypothetical protein DWQ01_07060 [Planctomycetota bacterium]|nr:MAG: hypothetical protein DWQ01_07060 [Planctomycetota bacterium]
MRASAYAHGLLLTFLTAIFLSWSPSAFGQEGLVLWNRLGSQQEVENSAVGLNGSFAGGSFVPGVSGNAFRADHSQDLSVTFPYQVVPTGAGTIEFWAKLEGMPTNIPWGQNPYFIEIGDGSSGYGMGFNGNDGGGGGGICGSAGDHYMCSTGVYTQTYSYESLLGSGQVERWHHYALVWDENNLPGLGQKVAVYLNGQLQPQRWHDYRNNGFPPMTGGELGLINFQQLTQGAVAIDELKIWDHARIPEPGLVLWNTLGSQAEVENSIVGLNGSFAGGSFVPGVSGNAFRADHSQNLSVTFPYQVIPTGAGTIEFWAKLEGMPTDIPWGNNPYFIEIGDGSSGYAMGFNGNDGGGGGGICGSAGNHYMCSTGSYLQTYTYEGLLGSGQVELWHHYVLAWDENNLPGLGQKVAVYLNGQLQPQRWHDYRNNGFPPMTGGELGLINFQQLTQGAVAIDELKIWDHARVPSPELTLKTENMVAGSTGQVLVDHASPGGTVGIGYSLIGGGQSSVLVGCGWITANLSLPVQVLGTYTADGNGFVSVDVDLPAFSGGRPVWFQALDFNTCTVSNSVFVIID